MLFSSEVEFVRVAFGEVSQTVPAWKSLTRDMEAQNKSNLHLSEL